MPDNLTLGPTPALIGYALGRCPDPPPVRLMLLRQGVAPHPAASTTYDSLRKLEHPRWVWRWPFWTGYRQTEVKPAVVSDGNDRSKHEIKLIHMPGHVWRNASLDVGGFAYYLDDGDVRPILLAVVYGNGGISSRFDDFTLEPSTAVLRVTYEN